MLTGKTLLITGVLMESSIAFHVARLAQEQGAQVILTSFGRTMKITQTIARRLPEPAPVLTRAPAPAAAPSADATASTTATPAGDLPLTAPSASTAIRPRSCGP